VSIQAEAGPRPAICVDELKRAWAAVQAGHFRSAPGLPGPAASRDSGEGPGGSGDERWVPSPGEQVVPVVGCTGFCGVSTVAVAIATAAPGRARVIECSSAAASGLAAASTAELGEDPSGWVRGTRDQVLLERTGRTLGHVEQVPVPSTPAHPVGLTVLDVGWDLDQVLAAPSWLRDQVENAETVVLVTTVTMPGFRRLEGALHLLTNPHVLAAVVGPRRRKWPRAVEHVAGPRTRALDAHGGLLEIPHDDGLAVHGLTATPLPPVVLHAAADLLGALPARSSEEEAPR